MTIQEPNPTSLIPQTNDGFYIQDNAKQTQCSAISLANFIHCVNPTLTMPDMGVKELVNKVPLSDETVTETLKIYGFQPQRLSVPEDVQGNCDAFAKHFLLFLHDSPVMLNISSTLSRRNRAVEAQQTFATSEEHGNKTVVHRVIMRANGDQAEIIDPYDPTHTEKFNIADQSERLRLTAWIMSAHFEKTGTAQNAAELIATTLQKINNPTSFENNLIFSLVTARIVGATPIAL